MNFVLALVPWKLGGIGYLSWRPFICSSILRLRQSSLLYVIYIIGVV